MKFIIDRSRWLRGEGYNESALLRESDGMMCCIGQVCRQLGVPDSELRGCGAADGIPGLMVHADKMMGSVLTEWTHGKQPVWIDQDWVTHAYEINDEESLSDAEREAKLQKIAADAGHEFDFVDEFVG